MVPTTRTNRTDEVESEERKDRNDNADVMAITNRRVTITTVPTVQLLSTTFSGLGSGLSYRSLMVQIPGKIGGVTLRIARHIIAGLLLTS